MREIKNNINVAKQNVLSLKGKNVKVKVNQGHNRISFYEGAVCELYPSVFTVRTQDGTKTFSYAEVHTGQVSFLGD